MDGMMISVAGYNDKLWDLLKLILEGMRDFEFDEDRYKVNLREISLRYENQVHSEPFKHANGVTNFLKFDLQWRSQDKLDAIEHVSLDLLRRFVDDIFRQLYVQMLVLGNYSENEALDISEKVMKYCSSGRLSEPEYVVPRCLLHPVGVYSLQVDPQSEKNVNSAVQRTIFTSNTDSPYYKAMVDLISNIVSEPLFDQLRTKEQLGYIVSSGAFIANGAPPSLYILVQSEVNPAYVDLRISSFLRAYSPIIRSLSQAEFDHHVNSLIVRRLQNPKCINEESSRFWVQIHSKFYDFEWREVEVSILKSLTLNDLFAFWDRYFLPHPNSKASHLVVSVHSSFVRKPTTLELQKYPQSIIALQGCLAKEGLSSELCSLKSLNALILDIASHLDLVKLLPSTIDDAIPYLISWCTPLYDSNPDQLDALKSKLVSNTGPTNYLRTALYMALEEYSYINHGYDHDHDIPSNKPNGISDSSPSLSTPASLKPTIPTVSSNTGVSKYKDPKQFEDTIKAARGLTKTPSGSWVFTDAVKYKNTSVISSGPFSFHPLIPKY
ncbi:Insulin-degrading enzyme [Zancudomyces culisetae]|uniref:Insulin-degrading enzyme n=1 Tax=Zancudomyces culisetae TaxID=1213189 RepID=A0A1R1PVX8_ZANCU|nr:Insulin-degrading enzyme [Zancudomyces culisetae]|eukprot:OMH85089.1 Insulin-degrading enzyme [Zancudomyces culisetae]